MKTAKILGAAGALLLAAVLVSASLLTYFGQVQTTMNVQQSVQIDGHNWDQPIAQTIDAVGGCSYCYEHTITNNGCQGIWLAFNNQATPDGQGIDVIIGTPAPPPTLKTLTISHLDGFADDSFDVYIGDVLVGSYADSSQTEQWMTLTLDLTSFGILAAGTHTVKIVATGEAWQYFNPYGQLGIDTIALTCSLDNTQTVNIGDPSSEVGYNLQGWGPIEPATHGGTWGGIDNCRVTWFYTEDPVQDEPWATVDFTFGSGDCQCEPTCIPMDQPFYLEAHSSLDICICYELSMLIAPGQYIVTSQLVPAPQQA